MKRKIVATGFLLALMLLSGCKDYRIKVLNNVNRDGSVLRNVIVTRETDEEFNFANFTVPVDSSWTFSDSMSISEDQDTTWFLYADKLFSDVAKINFAYDNADTAVNFWLDRSADFNKKFRWFTTTYRFSERVERLMDVEVRMEDYLEKEELRHYYLPESIATELENGIDSTYYETLNDSIEAKSEYWLMTGIIRQWALNLETLTAGQLEEFFPEGTWKKVEDAFIRQAKIPGFMDDFVPDSLLTVILGEQFVQNFQLELDSAEALLEEVFGYYMEVASYDMEIRMPGTITGTNGYLLTSGDENETPGILWTVEGDYFLAADYNMWVESQVKNTWAWYVSAGFLLFVILGLLRFRKRKK